MRTLEQRLANVDFVGRWRLWFSISFVLLTIGTGALAFGGLNLGIDFTGGTEFTATSFEDPASEQQVLSALPAELREDATVQSVGDGGYEISMPPLGQSETNQLRGDLEQELDAEVSATNVSPTFGGQSLTQALQALGVALLAITV